MRTPTVTALAALVASRATALTRNAAVRARRQPSSRLSMAYVNPTADSAAPGFLPGPVHRRTGVSFLPPATVAAARKPEKS